MATFSSLLAGPRARKPVVLPLPGSRFDGETGQWVGDTIPAHVRALQGGEHARVLEGARKYAIQHGVQDPTEDDELFEYGKMVHTLAIAFVDADSPEDAPRAFFDGGVEQILNAEALTPEVIAYLYECQQLHQDETNPLLKNLSPAEFTVAVQQTAQGDMSFFASSRPGMQWSFTHSMAKLLADWMTLASRSSSPSEPQPPTSEG